MVDSSGARTCIHLHVSLPLYHCATDANVVIPVWQILAKPLNMSYLLLVKWVGIPAKLQIRQKYAPYVKAYHQITRHKGKRNLICCISVNFNVFYSMVDIRLLTGRKCMRCKLICRRGKDITHSKPNSSITAEVIRATTMM